MREIWKEIEKYPRYEVSNTGKVRNKETKHLLRPAVNHKGYFIVSLTYATQQAKTIVVHRLVGLTFIPNPKNKPQINHKDCDKQNNNVSNLEWVTPSENQIHSYKNNRKPHKGEKAPRRIVNWEIVREIRKKRSEGVSSRKLALLFPQISRRMIQNIYLNRNWIEQD